MKSKIVTILLALCFVFLVAATSYAQGILVLDKLTNGDFEQGSQGWSSHMVALGTPSTATMSTTVAYMGDVPGTTFSISQTVMLDPWFPPSDLDLEFTYELHSSNLYCGPSDWVEVIAWEHYWFQTSTRHSLAYFGLCTQYASLFGPVQLTYDLSSLRHANAVTIEFRGQTDFAPPAVPPITSTGSTFIIDNVHLWEPVTITVP